ncbi:hypothetical protein B296_00037347 [Ensete ventricosum]|uniref:Uncharacterized protein n=1 Tax=Ensete ventricosum TaxID=4639 RepID=A0A426XAA0_ENSVE|nr:hypothetical protein B296_00037347 [Ensete ventricosum]
MAKLRGDRVANEDFQGHEEEEFGTGGHIPLAASAVCARSECRRGSVIGRCRMEIAMKTKSAGRAEVSEQKTSSSSSSFS